MSRPVFMPMEEGMKSPQHVNNLKFEATMRNQNKREIDSNYVIKWKNMSLGFRVFLILLLFTFALILMGSLLSNALMPFVINNNASTMDTTNRELHKANGLLQTAITNMTQLHSENKKLRNRMGFLEKDNMCYRVYILYLASSSQKTMGDESLETPEQRLVSCLQGAINS